MKYQVILPDLEGRYQSCHRGEYCPGLPEGADCGRFPEHGVSYRLHVEANTEATTRLHLEKGIPRKK